eukprot:5848207-Amphidinium_carterae.1
MKSNGEQTTYFPRSQTCACKVGKKTYPNGQVYVGEMLEDQDSSMQGGTPFFFSKGPPSPMVEDSKSVVKMTQLSRQHSSHRCWCIRRKATQTQSFQFGSRCSHCEAVS